MLIGGALSSLVALLIGLPTLRLRGAYFAVATVAFPLMTIPILNHLELEEVSIPFIRRASAMQFADMRSYVLIALVLLAAILIIVKKMEHSRFGYALKAIKQNEAAAEGMGINAFKTKLIAFMLSAFIAAIMGVLYSFSILYVLNTHSAFGLFIIVRILSITIVGGLGSLWGPVVGAIILVPLGEFLSFEVGDRYPGVQDIIYGAALVAAVIYMPEGIWGKISLAAPKLFKKKIKTGHATRASVGRPVGGELYKLQSLEVKLQGSKAEGPILRIEEVSKSFGGGEAFGKCCH